MVNGPPAARVRQPFARAVLQRDEWPSNMFIFSHPRRKFLCVFSVLQNREKKEGGKKQSALAIAFFVAT